MGKTHGSNFVPEPIPDGLDIRRISEPASKIAIPTHIEQSRILSSLFQEEEIHMLALCTGQVFNNTKHKHNTQRASSQAVPSFRTGADPDLSWAEAPVSSSNIKGMTMAISSGTITVDFFTSSRVARISS
jgi:hypothetical protein